MYFSDEFINSVKDANDIVEVISMYTTLKKNGNNYVGLCPFHSEKTPSFGVSADKQLYHCFGCQAGGTVINFIENIENYDFIETMKFLAQRAGIAIPEEDSKDSEEAILKSKIKEMNKIAGREYFKKLNSPEGKVALYYLRNRSLSDNTITVFGLGYAPQGWDYMYRLLKKMGYKDDEIIKSGLCVSKNNKIFDFFRDRVMFPVMDLRGNVIAFGGRILGDGQPKYLNTADTILFKKRQNLFNLNLAKNTNEDFLLLTEGYMDVISLYQGGFKNAIASLGTSLCDEHSRLLKRFTDKVIISYDSDEAGKTAAMRASSILKKDGLTTKIIRINGAKDPDELIKKFGSSAYREAIEKAMGTVDFDLMNIYPKSGFSDDEERIEYIKKAVAILKDVRNPLELEVYTKKASDLAKISYDAVMAQIKKAQKHNKFNDDEKYDIAFKNSNRPYESTLLKIIVENPSYFSKIKDKIDDTCFKDELNKKIFIIFKKMLENKIKPDVSMVIEQLEKEERSKASAIFIDKENTNDFMESFNRLLAKTKDEDQTIEFSSNDEEDLLKILNYTIKLKNGGKQ